MGLKDELRDAKKRVYELQRSGEEMPQIATLLNLEFEGFYYVRGGVVYRGNDVDYLPDLRIA